MKKVDTEQRLPPPPAWFDEEVLPQRLLHRLLDKIDKGQSRLALSINGKTAPELYDFQNEDVPYLWALIKSLDKEHHLITIKLEKQRPGKEPFENARIDFNPEKEAVVRHWLNRPAIDPYTLVWQHELARMSDKFEDGGRALAEQIVRAPEQGPERTLRAFARIGIELGQAMSLRTLSARCCWGDSKFLERHEDLVRQSFPSLAHNLLVRPILMVVWLPHNIEEVLFVENQDSFLALTQSGFSNRALIYAAGFRGSAQRIREENNVVFSYLEASAQDTMKKQFESWWFGSDESGTDIKCGFWGDLDFAGMGILKALRQTFSDAQAWKAGYGPMLERLVRGNGHAHSAGGKAQQKDPLTTGCQYADEVLLPAMRTRALFLDQEAVTVADLHLP